VESKAPKAKEVEERTLEKLKINLTDPESRIINTAKGYLQGYSAQAVVSEDQVIIVAELTHECNDRRQLMHLMEAVKKTCMKQTKAWMQDISAAKSSNVEYHKGNDPNMLLTVSKEYKNHRKDEDKVIWMSLTPASIMECKLKTKRGKSCTANEA